MLLRIISLVFTRSLLVTCIYPIPFLLSQFQSKSLRPRSNLMAAPTKSLTTESGTITAWLPVLTPYPSIAACSSQVFRNDGGIIAFDPYFPGHMGDTGVHCLPQELSLSWWQRDAGTTTILGPTFVCPEAWSVVKTIEYPTAVQSLCCPS
jgi:hypothetical protein